MQGEWEWRGRQCECSEGGEWVRQCASIVREEVREEVGEWRGRQWRGRQCGSIVWEYSVGV